MIYPYDPCEFSVEFVERMRKHPDIIQKPSSRQVQTIPQLLLARYLRKGVKLSLKDYIEISIATSFPNNQDLAKKIAFQILFPHHTIRNIDALFEENLDNDRDYCDELIIFKEQYELQRIQQLCNEIETCNNINYNKICEIEEFTEQIIQKRFEEPFKSSLVFFDDISELYKEEITTQEKLLNLTKRKLIEKINTLEPKEVVAAHQLKFNDLIEKTSRKRWEIITSKALDQNTIEKDLYRLEKKSNLESAILTTKYLKHAKVLNASALQKLKKIIAEKIVLIDDIFHAAIELNEIPDFQLKPVLLNAFYKFPLSHNLKLAKSLDQAFGTNLRASIFKLLNEELTSSESLRERVFKDEELLEAISNYAEASKSWLAVFEKILSWNIERANNAFRAFEEFKMLSHKMIQLKNSCENIHCSQKITQFIPDVVNLTVKACIVPTELKDVVEFLNKINLSPDKNIVYRVGKDIGMNEEEVAELIEPFYEVLKRYFQKPSADLKKIQELIEKIKNELNFEKILELMRLALGSDNREALAALGHLNLDKSLEAAKMIEGKQGMEKLISTLTAGDGESLITQWFLHREKIPEFLKEKIKDIAKNILIELGINYSRSYLGSHASGIIQTNLIRPYEIGDPFEDVDLESTIFNLLEKGKNIKHVTYDDFFVFISSSGLRSVCIEMDISESMTGEKLAYMAICVTMLVYGMKKDNLGIALFEKDTHILKEINQKTDLEELADNLLGMKTRGTTFVQKALHWARDQLKRAYKSKHKINIMFTDADIYDIPDAAETLRAFKSLGVDFILVCPENQYNIKESEKIIKLAGGQLLKVKKWEKFPELISSIINNRF